VIVYLDTSSLVKLYVEEKGSSEINELVRSSKISATSLVAYAEARAAFARRFREKAFKQSEYRHLIAKFNEDWNHYLSLRVTDKLVRLAGDLAEKHRLRGFDAIHLASSIILNKKVSSSVIFSCFDQKLQKTSALEGLQQPK